MSFPRRITWTWLAQVQETRQSLVPFLYETRTLTTSPRALRLQCRPFTWRRLRPQKRKSRTRNDHNHKSYDDNDHDLQATNLQVEEPHSNFLREKAASVASRRTARKPPWERLPKNKSADHATLGSDSSLDGAEAASKPKMTAEETRAFAALFQQLEEDIDMGRPSPSLKAGDTDIAGSPAPDQDKIREISSIFDTVMRDINARKQAEASQYQLSTNQILPERKAVAVVEDIEDAEEPETSSKDSNDKSHRINNRLTRQIIHRESLKIESALLSAAVDEGLGDTGIWNICKERIFSMVQYLETNEKADAIVSPLLHETDETEFSVPDRDGQSETESTTTGLLLDIPEVVQIEAVVSELYPKMLLAAFRLLNLHFPDSPLIGEFRPTINSFGRESTVIGSSTALYNELIYFYWRGRQDLPEVLSIIKEMEVLGLSPDEQTMRLLKSIMTKREKDLRSLGLPGADQNSGLWWDLPQNRKAVNELEGKNGLISKLKSQVRAEAAKAKWIKEFSAWEQ
ncbi:hypothetical protein BJX64DRAFT_261003 [Aspergillus heterothallicus]